MRHIIATLAASGSSVISQQIAESLTLKQLEVNLEDSVLHTSLKLFVQIFVQPPRKFSDVRKLTQIAVPTTVQTSARAVSMQFLRQRRTSA
jgi:hypothetical protein